MPKCNFNKVAKQLYWNHTSAWVISCKFAAFFIDNMNNGENVKGTMLIASRLVIDRIVASTITSTGGPKINDKMIKWKKLSQARYLMI